MEPREQFATVAACVFKPSPSGGEGWVEVELDTGHRFLERPGKAPAAGERVLVTVTTDFADLDPSLPFVTDEDRADARHVLSELGRS